MPPRVQRIEEYHQLWSIHIGYGRENHGWTFQTGENEPDQSTPMITPRLYHSIVCVGLTWTALAAITGHLGLHVPSSSHWHDFQNGKVENCQRLDVSRQ